MKKIRYERPNGEIIELPKGYNVNELNGQIKSGGGEVLLLGGEIVFLPPGLYKESRIR